MDFVIDKFQDVFTLVVLLALLGVVDVISFFMSTPIGYLVMQLM